MALSITVNGAGTFTASMEEGPVSFTASLAAVGPAGPAGATGPAGVVAASAPITYNAGTQTVGISDTPTFASVGFSSPGSAVTINAEYYIPFSATYDTAGMEYRGDKVVFPDNTEQVTAFVGESRKEYIIARNNTGSTIAKGKVVYLSGATGNKPTMALAQADAEATSARTIGILVEETANNADGKVIVSGAAENIDTSAFSDGDTLYLSASTAGGMTTTLPTQPLHGVVIGIVTRANPSVGSVEVAINNYQELEELSDVLISGEANNDLLAWDSTASVWKNRTFSALGLLTSSTAASTYAPIASPTFTGTVTIPAGASISGYLTTDSAASTYQPIGSYAVTNAGNTFSASQVISVTDNSNAALRVTQLGTGEALRVEDSANPDASPFVINSAGQVGIGTTSLTGRLNVLGNSILADYGSSLGVIGVTQNGTGPITTFTNNASSTADAVRITNLGSGLSLKVEDSTNPDSSAFVVDASGNVGVKTASPSTDLEVNGNAKFTTAEIVTAPAAGDSSAKVPTTAWVQTEVPSASTTAAGKVELATDVEAATGTSSALAVTPTGVRQSTMDFGYIPIIPAANSAATSGTGATSNRQGGQGWIVSAPTSVAGHGIGSQSITGARRSGVYQGYMDFSKPYAMTARVAKLTGNDSNSIFRLSYGKFAPVSAADIDASMRAFMIKAAGSGAIDFLVANGTALTTVTTTFTPVDNQAFDVLITSDGAGNAQLYINGTSYASTTGAPTNAPHNSVQTIVWQAEAHNTTTLTGTRASYCVSNAFMRTAG